jgi:cytochrome d ubiquinol oxidase subunit I
MSDLLAARSQMAVSLMFHILFAVAGMAMPVMMVASEVGWRRTGDPVYLDLTRRWARGTAILFAVGAVSGTVLSFELGLLWPRFMQYAGPLIGMPFSLEGFAFFAEAIFLGIYLYGWDVVPPRAHLAAGVVVALSGALSAVFVVSANAWMNTPAGFDRAGGGLGHIDPVAAMLNPAAGPEALHMVLAAYAAVGFAVAGIHAGALLRRPGNRFHRAALAIALLVGGPAAVLLLRCLVAAGPLGLIAIESGWSVTELGRQPWIIQGVMRTADAVTPMPGLTAPFATITAVYLALGAIVVYLLRRHVLQTVPAGRRPEAGDAGA